jgi:hypothetical protein
MNNYTTAFFVELLEDLKPQVNYLRTQTSEEITVMVFQGVYGNAVFIDTTDLEDEIDIDVAKGYLLELGLSSLIDNLFPDPSRLN